MEPELIESTTTPQPPMVKPPQKKFIVAVVLAFFVLVIGGVAGFFFLKSQYDVASTVQPTPTIPLLKPNMLHVITGTVNIKNVSTGEQKVAQKNQDFAIQEGDTIQTDTNTVATVDYNDGTLIRLSPESSVVYGMDDKKMHFQQILGNVYYRFKKTLGFREELDVETDTALAAVRGTTLAMFKYEGTKLVVATHQVDFYQKNNFGSPVPESKVAVDENMESETASNSASPSAQLQSRPKALTPKEEAWLDFNQKADQLYDKDQGLPNKEDLQTLETQALSYIEEVNVTPTLIPTNTPSATATPAQSPTPTVPPVPKITDMFDTGYHTGSVQTDAGTFSLSCIGANKNSTKVITDSANENDCANDCPVKPLADYVSANGGFAGMNGMYFCPPDYASCAGKTNSFDTLFFNSRVHRYINSDNNVYSVIPFFVVDGGGNPRFISHSQEWGRDTGIQAGTAGNPLLIQGGSNVIGNYSLDDKQRNTKSNRGAFVQKGDNIYLCITKGATVPDTGNVFQTLHVDNAINIDGGGSSAMYVNGGYKFGPGRSLPTAIIFANR